MSDTASAALADILAGPVRRVRGAWLPLFLMIGAAAVPIVAFGLIMLGLFNGQMERALQDVMHRTAAGTVAAVETKRREDTAALQALASGLEDGTEAFHRQAERLLAVRPGWLGLRLVDLEGRTLVAVGGTAAALPVIDSAMLLRVAARGEPAIGGVRAGDIRTEAVVPIYVPVHADGGVRHVLVASLAARSFSDLLMQHQPEADWVIALLDRDHRIVARSFGHDQHVGTAATDSLREQLLSEQQLFFSETKEGTQAFTAFARAPEWGWTVAVGAPAEIVQAPMRRTMLVVAGAGALALGLAVWASLVVARSAYRRQIAERRLTAIQTLQTAERRLSEIARNFPGVIYRRVLHADGRVSYPYVSDSSAFSDVAAPGPNQRLTLDTVGGLAFRTEDQEGWSKAVRESARTLSPFRYEGRIHTGDGALRWIRTMARPSRHADGSVVWDGVALDVTDSKLAEQHMAAALAEKEGMLREIHHRVRNNLQVVSSLLQIEAFQIADAEARRRLGDVSRRIGAMGHLHELLYGSTDFARLDCGEHLRRLCRTIQETQPEAADITVEAEALHCDLDTAIPLGLLAHELISFELAHSRRLHVRLSREPDGTVTVAIDCGCGGEELGAAGEIGSRIIHALAAQIDGALEIGHGAGQCVLLRIDGRRFT